MTTDLDFSPLQKSKITQGEFATLAGVSRVTVNGWMLGRMGINEFRKPRIERLLKVIEQATNDSLFPLRDTPRGDRLGTIKRTLVKYLKHK